MKRRTLVKAIGLAGLGLGLGRAFGIQLPNVALSRRMLNVDMNTLSNFNLFPRVINIFLYGGPSELGGNLSNIGYINSVSQSKYDPNLLLQRSTATPSGLISPNNLWINGGADAMEAMLAGGAMSIYRTMYRRKDDSKAHRESILQNQVGNLDMAQPGIASTVAELIAAQAEMGAFGGRRVSDLVFPFVSFEGESYLFNRGDAVVSPALRPASLGTSGTNTPYTRNRAAGLSVAQDGLLDSLATANTHTALLSELSHAFESRAAIAASIGGLLTDNIAAYNTTFGSVINYGATTNNQNSININDNPFGARLRAAVTLMLNNPDTLFTALSSDGLGGWDDHNEAQAEYSQRMDQLMHAIMAATAHIHAASKSGIAHANSIIINVMGDFGRNVNLNNAFGWDHGNNQNLYTFGGRSIRTAQQRGKIVGATKVIGTPGQNRLFTAPTDNSYEFEPFSVASTVYKYFGVTNPQVLSGEPAIDENTTPAQPLVAYVPVAGSLHERVRNFLLT
ncbi:MAG: DUF1501 domain-containing protein [Gammaproteobacteria bacterium]|nr:DUF1501 domain-containing protein [Gammaproteobacteria bacterium]